MCNNRWPEHSEVRSFRSSVVCQLLVYSNRHLFIGIFAGIRPQQDAARTTRYASVVCGAHLCIDWCWCSDGSQCQSDIDAQPGRNSFSIEASRLSGLCSLLWSGCIANFSRDAAAVGSSSTNRSGDTISSGSGTGDRDASQRFAALAAVWRDVVAAIGTGAFDSAHRGGKVVDGSPVKGFAFRTVPQTILPLVLVLPLVVREPDLGAAVFLAIGFVIALFIGGWPLKYFVLSLGSVIPVAASLLILKPYQMQRITGFIAAWQDLSQAPWQIRQSLLSIGAGGLRGTGVGSGWQKLSYLPEANTDFVFAVIGEELGLAGTLTLVILWMGVLMTGRAALQHLRRDSFAWILGNTLVIQIVVQALVNVAVVTAMVPSKGVPHPFISYGGTNLLVNIVAVGIIVAMTRAADDLAVIHSATAGIRRITGRY